MKKINFLNFKKFHCDQMEELKGKAHMSRFADLTSSIQELIKQVPFSCSGFIEIKKPPAVVILPSSDETLHPVRVFDLVKNNAFRYEDWMNASTGNGGIDTSVSYRRLVIVCPTSVEYTQMEEKFIEILKGAKYRVTTK